MGGTSPASAPELTDSDLSHVTSASRIGEPSWSGEHLFRDQSFNGVGSNTKQYHDSVTGSRRHFTSPMLQLMRSNQLQCRHRIRSQCHAQHGGVEEAEESGAAHLPPKRPRAAFKHWMPEPASW